MEGLKIRLNDEPAYREILKNSLPDGGDLRVITLDHALECGRARAMFTFTVQMPDGSIATVQTVTTVRLLLTLLAALRGRYDEDGRLRPMN